MKKIELILPVLILVLITINVESAIKSSIWDQGTITICIDKSCSYFSNGGNWDVDLRYPNNTGTGITGTGLTPDGTCYSITVVNLKPGYYYFSICDERGIFCCWGDLFYYNGSSGGYNFSCSGTNCLATDGGNGDKKSGPVTYSLSQNYPNPFNPETKISYSIAKDGPVNITVYDALGQEVTTLVNSYQKTGNYEAVFNGESLSSGMYFYKIISGSYTETKKMLLVK